MEKSKRMRACMRTHIPPCPRIRKTKTANMSILRKVNYTFSVIPIIIPKTFFIDTEKTLLKFLGNHKRFRVLKAKEQNLRLKLTINPGMVEHAYNLFYLKG